MGRVGKPVEDPLRRRGDRAPDVYLDHGVTVRPRRVQMFHTRKFDWLAVSSG